MKRFTLIALSVVALGLSGCALFKPPVGTGPGGTVTTADQVMQVARASCAAWPIIDGSFKGLTGSGLVTLPADAAVWEGGVGALVKKQCDQIAAADISGKPLDLSTIQGIVADVGNDVMAVTDYVAGLKKT